MWIEIINTTCKEKSKNANPSNSKNWNKSNFLNQTIKNKIKCKDLFKKEDNWKKKIKSKWLSKDHLKNKFTQIKNSGKLTKLAHSFCRTKNKVKLNSLNDEIKIQTEHEENQQENQKQKLDKNKVQNIKQGKENPPNLVKDSLKISGLSKLDEQKKDTLTLKYSFKESKNYKDYVIKITNVTSPQDSDKNLKVKTLKR